MRSLYLVAVVAGFALACSSDPKGDPDAGPESDGAITPDADVGGLSIDGLGPADIGFISSVAFHPSNADEVWASGDDASGLYRSTDGGATWSLVEGLPPNQSTYSLVFDATRPGSIYAPNHFGRGFLRSTDSGATWSVTTAGLPTTPGAARRANGLVVVPGSGRLLLTTASGIYRSDDGGATFALETATELSTSTDFTAIAVDATRVVAGSQNGRLYTSTDGIAWAELSTADSLPVTDIALSASAIYAGFAAGLLVRFELAGPITVLSDPNGGGFQSALWTQVAVVPGASVATDQVWAGVVAGPGIARGNQLFYSADGGATLTLRNQGLDGASIFDIAVDPSDPMHVVVGTVGEGVFATTDGGANWTRGTGELRASAILAFAEDPTDADHLIASSTESLVGTRGVYESTDGGATWTPDDGLGIDVISLAIGPDGTVLAGSLDFAVGGVKRRAPGSSNWTDTLAGVVVTDFVWRGSEVWAMGSGLHVSTDGGLTWTERLAQQVNAISLHPTNAGEMIACGGGQVVASTDGFDTVTNTLPIAAVVEVSACAFDTADPSTVLIAADTGTVFRSDNYDPSGTGVTFQTVTTPLDTTTVRSILTDSGQDGAWYLSAIAPDVDFADSSTSGILRSTDRGQTWEWLEGQYPGTLTWQLYPSAHSRSFYAAMWGGGGVLEVSDR